MATKAKSTAVAKVDESSRELAFAQADVPDYIKKDSNRGSEEVKTSDMTLPRLELIQSQSPIKEIDPDAREGMLFNSVTQEVYGDSVFFVPVYFKQEFLIWKDQNEGGGFFGAFQDEFSAEERLKQVIAEGEDPQFLEIVATPIQYGMLITPEGGKEQIVISMAKSKAKVSRKFNAMCQIAGGDRFGRVYKISSFTDENKKGQKFKNFVMQPAGFPPKEVYEEAGRVYESFRSGAVTVNHASAAEEGETAPAAGQRGEI